MDIETNHKVTDVKKASSPLMTLSPTVQGLAFLAVNSVMYSSRMCACVYMCMHAFIYTHRISFTVDVMDMCVCLFLFILNLKES